MEGTPGLIITPSPIIPKTLLEQISGCQVLTYLVENGSKPGDNWMSVLYTVTAEVIPSGKSTKETHYYLFKCYPQHPGRQTYLNKTNMFHNELSFYSIWAKALVEFQTEVVGIPKENSLSPAFPPYIGGKTIDFSRFENQEEQRNKLCNSLDNFLVLTDVRKTWGYQMQDSRKGLDFGHVHLVVSELAIIHALSWAYRKRVEWNLIKKFPFLKSALDQEDMKMWGNIVNQNVLVAIKTMDNVFGQDNHLSRATNDYKVKVGEIIKFFLEQTETSERECWGLHRQPPEDMVKASESETPWRVICHGDTWCNNLLFKYKDSNGIPERVMLVDFQLTREGCPTVDLVYFLYTSTTFGFRRNHLQDTLQLYCDKFLQVCHTLNVEPMPNLCLEELQRRFHRSKVVGYMMALTSFPMMLKDPGNTSDLEQTDKNMQMEDMFINAFSEGGNGSSLYKTRIMEIAQELYDEGVI